MAIHTVKRIVNGQPFSIETGRMAKQADGAVVVRMGDTMVLVAVVAAQKKPTATFFRSRSSTARSSTPPAAFPAAFSSARDAPASARL